MDEKYWRVAEKLLQKDYLDVLNDSEFQKLKKIQQSKYCCIKSLQNSIKNKQGLETAYWIRQCIETILKDEDQKQWILISKSIFMLIKEFAEYCGLELQDKMINGMMRISKTLSQSDKKHTKELINLEETVKRIYKYCDIAKRAEVLGDAYLKKYTGFDYFTSYAQKLGVYEAIIQVPGTSLVASLPTGGGKSLFYILPSLMEKGKLTIVIEPTVSLIMDQKRVADAFFEGHDEQPDMYYANVEGGKSEVLRKLIEGKTSILYISPEAILQPSFMSCFIELGKRDKIGRLVIDEVHLAEEWGRKFRTEFQFIGVLKKKLNKYMTIDNKLKTIFLSATITDNVTQIIENILTEENEPIFYVKGERVRNEIIYHVMHAEDKSRQRAVLYNVLPYMPKPCIIYVDEKDDAREIYGSIYQMGYRNIGIFTGDTYEYQRHELLTKWEKSKIDIMVANSAFGMGVDKPNIRSVIQCYVPENFNRFYQEAGRAGRDGANTVSLWLYNSEDIKAAERRHNSDVLRTDSMEARWEAILQQRVETYYDNTITVTMDAVRDTLQGTVTGEQNRDWNESMILLYARYGVVKIVDIEKVSGTYHFTLEVDKEMLKAESMQQLQEKMRTSEKKLLGEEFTKVKEYLKNPRNECLCKIIGKVYGYKDSEIECGGCPHCHEMQIYSNRKKERVSIKIPDKYLLAKNKSGYLIYKGYIVEKVKELASKGIRYFMFADREVIGQLINDEGMANEKVMMVCIDINNKKPEWTKMIHGTCAVFYRENKRRIYQYLIENNMDRKGNELFGMIHVIDEDFECETNRRLSQNIFQIY